jgi:hypothetical protein
MLDCPRHGFAPSLIYSSDLLELQPDGTVPDVIVVEVGEYVTEHNFFRFNVSPAEAAKLPVKDGCIPFDLDACEIMDGLQEMCGFCFGELREALKAQQARGA